MKTEQEKYIDLIDYEELYQVSNFGNVIGKKRGGKIKHYKSKKGHAKVSVSRNSISQTFTVAHLVAKHFLDDYTGINQIVAHKDGDRSNNKTSNLKITKPKGNPKHESDNVCYKVFDARNRLILVSPTKGNARSYVREQTGIKNYKTVLDTLIDGQFIIRRHVNKPSVEEESVFPISLVNDRSDKELIGSLYK